MNKLDEKSISERLPSLKGWSFDNNKLIRNFKLDSFSDAVAFVVKIAIESEKIDHHPDIRLFGWNNVEVTLQTHNVNGITENDFKLANSINILYSNG
ncbi:pterin-4-alpha-carbinolamine dehydratase [Melioribacter roseus P3M-2]|uniref:4a-hydroxytetrahydrobiopterin dehydratase n=1 Tax=Melioribacter roseus (strain DSM 23840 / JCM 17771 / VKM B-2668 / P3M-2) TaxID=1191523 RepID=I6ZUL0_MELRP|nr:4a-hydroxytetrahydrobiopterin dehydratase [Melioribacter roseus]AFN75699.1 pterin-4-alpha-carbinolamine dehydratase [Melioribacter roseus P3M-2]